MTSRLCGERKRSGSSSQTLLWEEWYCALAQKVGTGMEGSLVSDKAGYSEEMFDSWECRI